jgi:RecA-family ATPase
VGEGPVEWMAHVRAASGDEAILPELQKLIDAAVFVEYLPPIPEAPKGVQLEVKSIADYAPATQQWLFDKVVPQGKLTVLMGESGVGKSLTALEIAAKVTRGLTGAHDDQPKTPGSVVLFSPADGVAENIRPRLEASGADLKKVLVIPGFSEQDDMSGKKLSWEFQLDRDMLFLETRLKQLQQGDASIRMLVIDPIECFLESARLKRKEIAESLAKRLSKLAAETGLAIVVVTNLPRGVKGSSRLNQNNRYAVDVGPLGAVARSVWMVGQDLENRNRRLLMPVKTNYCELPNSLAFQIKSGVIDWELEPPTLTGDEYLLKCEEQAQGQKRAEREARSKLAKATKWLRGVLIANDGPLPKEQLLVDAEANNITKATLRRAYDALDCGAVNDTFQGKWYWYLPEMIPKKGKKGRMKRRTASVRLNMSRHSCAKSHSCAKLLTRRIGRIGQKSIASNVAKNPIVAQKC